MGAIHYLIIWKKYLICRKLRLQNHPNQPNSGTKSMYSMWIALPRPPVAEKVLETTTNAKH